MSLIGRLEQLATFISTVFFQIPALQDLCGARGLLESVACVIYEGAQDPAALTRCLFAPHCPKGHPAQPYLLDGPAYERGCRPRHCGCGTTADRLYGKT
jgi:hypothetical protein